MSTPTIRISHEISLGLTSDRVTREDSLRRICPQDHLIKRNTQYGRRSLRSRQEELQHPLGGFDREGNEELENCVQNPSQR